MNFKLSATCAAGIESIVGNELKHLGYKVNVENGRVRFDGDVAEITKIDKVQRRQAITKKKNVTKMSTVYHRRKKLAETRALYTIEVAINKDNVLITLDTTGSSLFKPGYRVHKGGAPLKENMAAALV